jgi:hypothetical protein
MSDPYLEGETDENKLAVRVIEGWKARAEKAEERVWELESLITSLKKGIGTGWMSLDDVREVLEQ